MNIIKYVLTRVLKSGIILIERRNYDSRQKSDKGTGSQWLGLC